MTDAPVDSHEDLIRRLLVSTLETHDTRLTDRSPEEFYVGQTAIGSTHCTDDYWDELKDLMGTDRD